MRPYHADDARGFSQVMSRLESDDVGPEKSAFIGFIIFSGSR